MLAARTEKSLPLAALGRFAARLATPLVPDDYIELLNPLWTRQTLHARIESVTVETADSATLSLRPGAHWQGHRAGQFLRLAVAINGVRHTRCYSISSAPERADGCISITVKAVADGRVSNHLVRTAKAGGLLEIAPADGSFVWPDQTSEGLLLIAAGSGITPIMAQLRSAAARQAMPQVTLLYYTPAPQETIFRAELQALAQAHPALSVQFVHTRLAGDSALSGHFQNQHLDRVCPDWRRRTTFACGPTALLESLVALWASAGLSDALITERFRAALPAVAADAAGGAIGFARSEQQAEGAAAESILDAAERSGLAPAHGCRMGICHGCTVSLICGQVRDLRDGRIHGEPGDLIQICVCAPAGDVQIDL